VEALLYGHSHCYERGALPDANVRLLLAGGGGSSLDRWGMYGNQEDYPEIHRSHDHYGYTLFDVDCANGSYEAESYTLGHPDLRLDNELLEAFSRDRAAPPPERPAALAPTGAGWPPLTLEGSAFAGDAPIMTSRFQLTDVPDDWAVPLLDSSRDFENVYGDTGPPDYEPIDLNAGIDLTRLTVPGGTLPLGRTYWWRVRYRDRNLRWSDWSAPARFRLVLPPLCDDGLVEGGEECDDGNDVDDGNGCGADCRRNDRCGDGVLQGLFEECDDGDTVDNGEDGCLADCSAVQRCGDGRVAGTEVCDDGNLEGEDGCSAACAFEWRCPDAGRPAECPDAGAAGGCPDADAAGACPDGDAAGGRPDAGAADVCLGPAVRGEEAGCGCRVGGEARGGGAAGLLLRLGLRR